VFAVISAVDQWPSWNPDITSTLQVVDPPREIAWTGTTIGKGYSRRTMDKGIGSVLAHLKAEAERRAATA
jgi:hypothetical protein